jgi:hypothetical protein
MDVIKQLSLFWHRVPRPLDLIKLNFSLFCILLTVVKGVNYFKPVVKIEGVIALAILELITLVSVIIINLKPLKIKLKIPHSNTTIEVLFGDLFEQDGIKVIPANEFFDSEIGSPVSGKSLHGILLKTCFGGYPDAFDKQIENQLKEVPYLEKDRKSGKTKSYPIGTNALITANLNRYIVFALSNTDTETNKAFSDATKMWDALNAIWKRGRTEANGHELNLPVIGSGLSGIGLPIRDLLNLIIFSAIIETKSKEITNTIRIVLHENQLRIIDLKNLKLYWEAK